MPTKDEWIECFKESLEVAKREGDKERVAACEAELKHLGAPVAREKAVKAAAAENTSKK